VSDDLRGAFGREGIDGVVKILDRVLAAIPLNLHDRQEKYYHSLIYGMMVISCLDARTEDRTRAGSADIVVERNGKFFVIEVKTASNAPSLDDSTKKALAQIRGRGYYTKFPLGSTKLVGLVIDLGGRKIGRCIVENV
jgi:hypothetical protein